MANHLVCIEQPHHRLRSLNGGNNGRSTNIGIFWVPASNEAAGRSIGAKAVVPGLVHPAWPDHGWGSLVPYRDRPYPTTNNLRSSSVGSLAMLLATRRTSSIVSTLATSARPSCPAHRHTRMLGWSHPSRHSHGLAGSRGLTTNHERETGCGHW